MSFDIGSQFKSALVGFFKGAQHMCGYGGSCSDLQDISAAQKKDDGERQNLIIKQSTEKIFKIIREFESERLKKPACQPYAAMMVDTHELSSDLASCLKELPLEDMGEDERDILRESLIGLAQVSSFIQKAFVDDFVAIKPKVNAERAKVITKLVDGIIIKGQR